MHTILSSAAPAVGRTRPNRAAGFTLVELIVLAVIVALAAAVFIPALVHASLTPEAALCQSNLRVMGMAHMLYADDHADYMCGVMADNYTSPYSSRQHWFNLLSGYAGQQTGEDGVGYYDYPDVFRCPSFTPMYDWSPGYGLAAIMPGLLDLDMSIMYENVVHRSGEGPYWVSTPPENARFFRRGEIALPSQRGWQGDSDEWHMAGGPGQDYEPTGDEWPNWAPPGSFSKAPERHGDAANFLFVDAHVENLHWSVSGNAFWDVTKMLHPGDFNGDMTVSGADYVVWANNFGWQENDQPASARAADANRDGEISAADYVVWADHFGEQRTPDIGINQASVSQR